MRGQARKRCALAAGGIIATLRCGQQVMTSHGGNESVVTVNGARSLEPARTSRAA